ncbi:MAG: SGNH/GDSL hydrolase family protein [Christensenellales bacterium]
MNHPYENRIVYIFGDSLAKGVLLDDATGRYKPGRIIDMAEFERSLGVKIYNESMFGCTIQKGCERLKKRLGGGAACDTVLLEFGGNDCDFNWAQVAEAPLEPHEPKTPLPLFKQTYLEIIEYLQPLGVRVILLVPPPIDSRRYLSWITRNGLSEERILQFLGEVQRIDHHQQLYALAVMQVAYQSGCDLVDLRSPFLDKPLLPYLCRDGIHLNARGQELVMHTLRNLWQLQPTG